MPSAKSTPAQRSAPLAAKLRVYARLGIGGSQDYLRVRLTMSFPTSSPEPHPLPIWVSVPIATDIRADSIIGMEALVNFRLTIAASEDRVELEPLF